MSAEEAKTAFRELIAGERICILVTVGPEGHPMPRPMGVARVDEDFTVWFATYIGSRKVQQIREHPVATVYWQKTGEGPQQWTYGQLWGAAEVTTEQALKDEIWNDLWAPYFPGKSKDPNLALIKVTPIRLELVGGGHEIRAADL